MSRRSRRGHSRGAYPTARHLSFDGVDQYGHADAVATAITGLTTVGSMAVWFKTDAANGWLVSAGKNSAGGLSDRAIGIAGDDLYSAQVDDAGTNSSAVFTTYVPTDTWQHAVSTVDGATARLYLAGAEVQTGALGAGATTMDQLNIARRIRATSLYLEGEIAEVLVFDRVLTAAEVAELYGGGYWSDPRRLQPLAAFVLAPGDSMLDLGWGAAAMTLVNAPTATAGGPNG